MLEIKKSFEIIEEEKNSIYELTKKQYKELLIKKWVSIDSLKEFLKDNWSCCGCGQCINYEQFEEMLDYDL